MRKYSIQVTKVYTYPQSMLVGPFYLGDAMEKANSDLKQEILEELEAHPDKEVGLAMFDVTVAEEVVDRPNNNQRRNRLTSVDLGGIIGRLAEHALAKKYGELSYEKNPKLYNVVKNNEDVFNPFGDMIRRGGGKDHYIFKPEIQAEYNKYFDEFNIMLRPYTL